MLEDYSLLPWRFSWSCAYARQQFSTVGQRSGASCASVRTATENVIGLRRVVVTFLPLSHLGRVDGAGAADDEEVEVSSVDINAVGSSMQSVRSVCANSVARQGHALQGARIQHTDVTRIGTSTILSSGYGGDVTTLCAYGRTMKVFPSSPA